MSDVVIENSSSPIPALSLATPDNKTIVGHGTHDYPLRAIGIGGPTSGPAALVASTELAPGTVIYPSGSGIASPALAGGAGGSQAIGIVSSSTPIAAAATVEYSLLSGLLTLAASLWDAQTGQSGGLTPGANYYLSATTAGHLTTTPTTVFIGTGVKPTVMALSGQTPSVVPAAPTTEHLASDNSSPWTVVASPTIAVTFVDATFGIDHTQTITLADGTIDGFEKTIIVTNGQSSNTWVVTPAHGAVVDLPFDGAATFRWDATNVVWVCTALRDNT